MRAVGRFLCLRQMVFLESFAFFLRKRFPVRCVPRLPGIDLFCCRAPFASRPQIVHPVLALRLLRPSQLRCYRNRLIGPDWPWKKKSRLVGLRSNVRRRAFRYGNKEDAALRYETVVLDVAGKPRDLKAFP